MRLLEKVMAVWPMPELSKQIDAFREAFSADTRKPFVLKPSFPYGSPHSSNQSTPPRLTSNYRPNVERSSSIEQQLDSSGIHQSSQVSYTSHPISPPTSAGPLDSKSDSPTVQSLVMMAPGQVSQAPVLSQSITLADAPTWNPSRIFEYVHNKRDLFCSHFPHARV
jgi:hypothetical protein